MKMTIDQIKKHIDTLPYCIIFQYRGKWCGFDPQGRGASIIWYGEENDAECKTSEETVSVKIFDGKSLRDIYKYVEFYDG